MLMSWTYKILCLLGVFALMLGGILIPVRVMQKDYVKVTRYRRVVALSNSFGGVFLATCFNALLPAVREKVCYRA
ncbi:zinc transporter ZIP3-like [Siphateles boraxobius]|uniref:zinc transporter ZIP3-like n=1 Tax=Siphateles boraxobius TaxID=180520 RepID=UPI00406490DB